MTLTIGSIIGLILFFPVITLFILLRLNFLDGVPWTSRFWYYFGVLVFTGSLSLLVGLFLYLSGLLPGLVSSEQSLSLTLDIPSSSNPALTTR